MPYKDPDKQRHAIKLASRKYRKKKVEEAKELRNLMKKSYDPFMDSVVIPRTELEKLNFKVS
jgi:hypothetical protein